MRERRAVAVRAEADVLGLAVEWAHAHPMFPGDGAWHAPKGSAFSDGGPDPESDPELDEDEVGWFGIPRVAWDAFAPFAAANGMSTAGGTALIRDALILAHRLPRVWARVQAGQVPSSRARRIAQTALGAPADVALYLDSVIAPRADRVGAVTLERLLDEAMLRLHPEERELRQLGDLDSRHATLHEESLNESGIVEMAIRGDWADLKDFDRALSLVAHKLGQQGQPGHGESLDVRRAMAVGVLADPLKALALLTGDPEATERAAKRKPAKQAVVYWHLSEAAVRGLDPLGFDEDGRPVLEQLIRQWLGRTDTHLTIKPIRDLASDPTLNGMAHHHDRHALEDYAPSEDDKERIWLRDRHCVFPWCTRKARRCDCDHHTPFHQGGPSCPCQLVPLCRHHHRLKTHAGWRYTIIEPGIYLWRDPHGQRFLRTRDGTLDVTPQRASPSHPTAC